MLTLSYSTGHRSTVGAHMSVRTSKSPMAIGVTYDRYKPGARSSVANLKTNNNNVINSNKQKLTLSTNKSGHKPAIYR